MGIIKFIRHCYASAISKAFVAALLSASVFGCIPTDQPIPVASSTASSSSYAGFTGATSAVTAGPTKVKISWNPATDPSVIAYNIYNTTNLFAPTLIKTVPATITNYTLTGLINENLYTFRVRAANAADVEDSNTNDVQAIPYGGVVSATVLSSTSASLTFNDGSNADQINIYCQTNLSPTYTLVKSITNVSSTTTTLTGLSPGAIYTCRAALQIAGYTDNNLQTVTFTPIGQASQLVFHTQPGSANAGAPLSPQPAIYIMDVNNNIVSAGPDSTAQITLTFSGASPTSGSMTGTLSLQAVGGIATFTNVAIQTAGIKILTATKSDTSGQTNGSGPLTVDSSQFTISAGTADSTKSIIAVAPATGSTTIGGFVVADTLSSYTVTITLQDTYGNPISGVLPKFTSSNASDSITKPTVATSALGVTTGSISTGVAGVRTLTITTPSLTTNVNATFVPGTPSKLVFLTNPATQTPAGVGNINNIQVAVGDSQGNTVTSSTLSITLSFITNPSAGTLSGTVTQSATGGIATFTGLGVNNIGSGYKLQAISGGLIGFGLSFNVTAGNPTKLAVVSPTSVISGASNSCAGSSSVIGPCCVPFTFKLEDNGGNLSNALAATQINLSGFGGGGFYTSGSCTGTAIGSSFTFQTSTNTKTYYFLDPKAEVLTVSAVDAAGQMTPGTSPIVSTPAMVAMTGPTSVAAGHCSTAFTLTTTGYSGTPGPVPSTYPLQVSGLNGTTATLWGDSNCNTTSLNPASISAAAGTSTTTIYVKDNKAESFTLSVSDPAGIIQPSSLAPFSVSVSITASNLVFTAPSPAPTTAVVAGTCSALTAFTVQLSDASNNPVTAPSSIPLAINGLAGKNGGFYYSSTCTGLPLGNTFAMNQGSSSVTLYFKDPSAENLSIYISDPAAKLANSQTLNIGVSPSALAISAPGGGTAATNICSGPFTIKTLDGSTPTPLVATPLYQINVNLSGAGAGGSFYTDNLCATTPITSITFPANSVGTQTFYFQSYYPGSLTLKAQDQAGILSQATSSWNVTAANAWIGTGIGNTPPNGNLFTSGQEPVTPRTDGARGATDLHFDSTGKYLYVVDYPSSKVLKYDYLNQQYIGWIGNSAVWNGYGLSGSNLNPDGLGTLSAQCVALGDNTTTPGWCTGGQSQGSNTAKGGFSNPMKIADDGTFIYVTNNGQGSVSRFFAATGVFAGWIGQVGTMPTGYFDSSGNFNTCTSNNCTNNGYVVSKVTPTWSYGGSPNQTGYGWNGPVPMNGNLWSPHGIQYVATDHAGNGPYLYVTTVAGVYRFHADTGAFSGWIGLVYNNPTGSDIAANVTTCSTTGYGTVTPGWCTGGNSWYTNNNTPGWMNNPNALYADNTNDFLYVIQGDYNGTIQKFVLSTGAYVGVLKQGGFNGPTGMTFDGTYFLVGDSNRIVKMGPSNGVIYGWTGKIGSLTPSLTCPGHSGMIVNSNTPGWCQGGNSENGVDEQSLTNIWGIAFDGTNILTGEYNYPAIKKFSNSTGLYVGEIITTSNSPTNWSTTAQPVGGMAGFDDNSVYGPEGVYSDGTNLYITDIDAGRIKKVSVATGQTLGWIGQSATTPTGGAAGCTSENPNIFSTLWCLGSWLIPTNFNWNNIVPQATDGLLYNPGGITGDSTYIYVSDYNWHRILRYNKSTGAYGGWIGYINSPTTSPAQAAGTITTGWSFGGYPQNVTGTLAGQGGMQNPGHIAIIPSLGYLYVYDNGESKVNVYNSSTGAFLGWFGQIATSPGTASNPNNSYCGNSSGFTGPLGSAQTTGLCFGGAATSMSNSQGSNPGGGFTNWQGWNGIATDGNYIYVSNSFNLRIDKFTPKGIYLSSFNVSYYNNNTYWTSNPTTWGWCGGTAPTNAGGTTFTNINQCGLPEGIWIDSSGTYLYAVINNAGSSVVKYNLATGNSIGWQGGISGNPTSANCQGATGATPAWCQGGSANTGYNYGSFSGDTHGISGDANYVYITDHGSQRVVRIPR